jgi:hypothetical protein
MNNDTKNYYKKLSNIYLLSLSTIADILYNSNPYLIAAGLKEEYIIKKDNIKATTIKPRITQLEKFNLKDYSKVISNILYIYATKDFKEISKIFIKNNYNQSEIKKKIDKWLSKVDKELKTRKDKYWNYNAQARNMTRFIKYNKDYAKKLIGDIAK